MGHLPSQCLHDCFPFYVRAGCQEEIPRGLFESDLSATLYTVCTVATAMYRLSAGDTVT